MQEFFGRRVEMDKGFQRYEALRDKAGLIDANVAKAAGFRPSVLSDWKAGRYKPKVDKLAKIAAALGCGLEELLDFEEV